MAMFIFELIQSMNQNNELYIAGMMTETELINRVYECNMLILNDAFIKNQQETE